MTEPSPRRILIVEDEQTIADTLIYALGTDGFSTEHCWLGRDALAVLRRGGFDLVVLDVGLPDMNGFDLRSPVMSIGCSRLWSSPRAGSSPAGS